MTALYDQIGKTYRRTRAPDPRIQACITASLSGCTSVLNVGAGSGSYELNEGTLVALEPSAAMIAQRPPQAAPVVQGRAEALPFKNASFDAVTALLTIHHWSEPVKGLAECRRVARDRVVLFTIDPDVIAEFWLFDYFPRLLALDRGLFPALGSLAAAFDSLEAVTVPIPADCCDGFLGAFWRRPAAYLDEAVRAGISTYAKLSPAELDAGVAHLRSDLSSGAWQLVHEDSLSEQSWDLGYRLLIGR